MNKNKKNYKLTFQNQNQLLKICNNKDLMIKQK